MPPVPTPAAPTAKALADELVRARLLDADQLTDRLAGFPGGDATALAAHLVHAGALTEYQAARALDGTAAALAIGPYRVTGDAVRGLFGPLYPAVHAGRTDPVLVHAHPVRNLWRARQAKQFARALAAGAHPLVPPLLDADSARGVHFLVWPHVPGTRLADLVAAHGPLPAGAVAALLGQAAGALAAVHATGAAHGALTPHALAVGPDGRPVVLEFGVGALLAQCLADDESMFDTLSSASAAAAVLAFAAPELAAAPDVLTAAADQYALGAIGYFAATGLAPFPHPALADRLRAKRGGPPAPAAVVNPAVPAALAEVLDRMMAPNPAARYPDLAAAESALARCAPPDVALADLLPRATGARRCAESAPGAPDPAPSNGSEASVGFDVPVASDTLPGAPAPDTPAELPRPAELARPAELPPAAPPPVPAPPAPARPKRPDPRLSAPDPVEWHAARAGAAAADAPAAAAAPPARPSGSVWAKLMRNVLFWQPPTDTLQVSVFGPAAATPGRSVRLTVFVHVPGTAENVRVLVRAFQHDAELLGTGFLTREVARDAALAVHLSVANAGVDTALHEFKWAGQPKRLEYDLHVPWESPEGAAPGLVAVGAGPAPIGKIEFRLQLRPRRA